MSNKPTLDEILGALYAYAYVQGNPLAATDMLGRKLLSEKEAKQQLTQLIADIIGEDKPNTTIINIEHNAVRYGQRQRAKERGIDL